MALLDLDALLAPIPGDNPAGSPVPYLVRTQLEEARRETEPAERADGAPGAQPRRVDWEALARLAQEILCTTSKDLLVAARLTEALTYQHGFPGLAEGLTLLRRLIEECWDRVHPAIEDGDLEVRAAPFSWLADPDRGACFPVTVRSLPLIRGAQASISWLAWKRSQEAHGADASDGFAQAVEQTSRQGSFRAMQEVERAVEECSALITAVNARLGEAAPSMDALSEALADCLALAQHVLARKGGPPASDMEEHSGEGEAEAGPSPSDAPPSARNADAAYDVRRAFLARNDVYRRLAKIGEELRTLEPHSPVPFLIKKAVAWGSLSFPDLIRVISREEGLIHLLGEEAEAGPMEASPGES